MKNPIICFIGLDGSGKSTCVEYAEKLLRGRGVKVKKVRAAYVLKVMNAPVKLGKKLLMKENSDPYGGDYAAYLNKMRAESKKGINYRIYSFLSAIEFKTQLFFNIRLNSALGYTLLVDRYVYDNAVTSAANTGRGGDYIKHTIKTKWKNAPAPDMIIYIKTRPEVCMTRKNDIPDVLYLQIREPLYDFTAREYGAKTVSGAQDRDRMLEQVGQLILRAVGND